jgi:hypothetical protein
MSSTSWISNDVGATWKTINPKTSSGDFKRFVGLRWHPKKSDWVLSVVLPVTLGDQQEVRWNFVFLIFESDELRFITQLILAKLGPL